VTVAGGDGTGGLDPDVARAVGDFVDSAARLPMDRLLDVEVLAASAVGASGACIYIADYAQQLLSPMRGTESADAVQVDATVHGRVFQTGQTHLGDGHVIAAMVEGRDRIGVVECTFDHGGGSVDLVDAIGRALLLVLVSKRRYTDLVLRARRVRPLSTAAEMQWDLLPPLSGQASGASVAGIVEPAYSTGGDSFDYAVNGDLLEFIVIDAVGHGMPAVLMSMAAITTYRNVRRERGSLEHIYAEIGRVMIEQFGHSYYVTGVIASLRTSTGELTWINAGHPEPMLVRDGSVIPSLHCAPSKPMGLGGTVREQQTITLQPADRVLVFTDGVVERRHAAAASPHLAPLTDLLLRATLDELAGPETVRRLARSVLDSCDGELDDDATLVLVDYHGRPTTG
jgi:phosphoserine phosphatase RsbU/P